MSTLMFWNKQNSANNQNSDSKNSKRNWLHAPDALLNGHVVYLVKFLGNTSVEQPKGIEVVKDAIRRLQFNQQIKKAETGNQPKLKKVEITISVDGVAIQEPRIRKVLHQYPLHNISYCADEKGVKKFFSFIAKHGVQNGTVRENGHSETNGTNDTNGNEEKHECFVFVSSKLASDITLTIGQAFDLAYRRYMDENGKTTELTKMQQQTKHLEKTVTAYKNRLKEISEIIPKTDLDKILSRMGIQDLFEVPQEDGANDDNLLNGSKTSVSESSNDEKLLIETSSNKSSSFAPIIPPRNLQNQINNTLEALKPSGQKMDELLLNSDSDSDFDPRAEESDNGNGNKISNDLFGFEPKTFGQQLFANNINNNNNTNNNNNNNSNSINSNNNNLTNGVNSVSPPPLLAPPPKAAVPRRTATNNTNSNGFMNGNQDLFGSVPFNPNSPSIFDNQFGNDTYVVQESSFHQTTSNISPPTKTYPTLQLNSTAFEDSTLDGSNSFGATFTASKPHVTGLSNPFVESGVYDMNDSSKNSLTSDINAFSSNSNILDDVLKSNQPSQQYSSSVGGNKFGNHEMRLSNSLGCFNTPISNPFTKKATEVLLSPRRSSIIASSNYDALRNSPDIDAMDMTPPHSSALSNPITIKGATGGGSGFGSGASSGGQNSAASSYDIFKEAASKAFSELSPSGRTGASFPMKSPNPNEFSNKMSGMSFGFAENKSNFNPTSKQMLIDDFSLESLDPLRK